MPNSPDEPIATAVKVRTPPSMLVAWAAFISIEVGGVLDSIPSSVGYFVSSLLVVGAFFLSHVEDFSVWSKARQLVFGIYSAIVVFVLVALVVSFLGGLPADEVLVRWMDSPLLIQAVLTVVALGLASAMAVLTRTADGYLRLGETPLERRAAFLKRWRGIPNVNELFLAIAFGALLWAWAFATGELLLLLPSAFMLLVAAFQAVSGRDDSDGPSRRKIPQ